MRTVKQVSSITGVSVRTLQYYDEIGLLKPTKVTEAGYRLYDENALERLQQIMFFKELDFTLNEIKVIMYSPQFDRAAAYKKQRELIEMKRDRLNALLGLLDRIIKGEKDMDFKDFDLSQYYRVLEYFKTTHTDEIVKRFGSMEKYDEMVAEMRSRERGDAAAMAVKLYGSIDNYTKAMEKNLSRFLSQGPEITKSEAADMVKRTESITQRLTADLSRDAGSPEVQKIVWELISYVNDSNRGMDMGENYWSFMAESYRTNPVFIQGTDQKYGKGASEYIGLAITAYLDGK